MVSSWYIIIRIFDCVDACKEDFSLIKTIPFPYTSQTTIREGVVLIRLESLFENPSVLGKKRGFAVFSCANNQHTRDMGQGLVCLYFDKGFYPSKYILDGHPQQQASILFFWVRRIADWNQSGNASSGCLKSISNSSNVCF